MNQVSRSRGDTDRGRIGLIGVVVAVLIVTVSLQTDKLPFFVGNFSYSAYFGDAGGLATGDIVVVSGVKVGSVSSISLADTADGRSAKVSFDMDETVRMGSETRALIKTETVLGRRNLTLIPGGGDVMRAGDEIPLQQTTAPYSLADALEGATESLEGIDTEQLNNSLNTLSATFSETPASVRAAVDGVAKLSATVADRDVSLRQLLARTGGVTDVLARRSGQIDTLLEDANSLLGELQNRRYALGELISGIKNVTAQISAFVDDNTEQLAPVLEKLNRVVAILDDNQENLGRTLDGLGPYANVLGEAVASGPYFSSLVGIPTSGDITVTFLDIMQQKYPEAYRAFMYSFPIPMNIEGRPSPTILQADPSNADDALEPGR